MFTRDLDYYGIEYDTEAITDGDQVIAILKEEIKVMKREDAQLKERLEGLFENISETSAEVRQIGRAWY